MFLSDHPEDNECLLAAETHDSQTKLIQSKTQLMTVFLNLWGKKPPLMILLTALWYTGENKVIYRNVHNTEK